MKLVNDTVAYAPGKVPSDHRSLPLAAHRSLTLTALPQGAVKSTLDFTAYDSVDLVTPFLEQGAVFITTKIKKTQGAILSWISVFVLGIRLI